MTFIRSLFVAGVVLVVTLGSGSAFAIPRNVGAMLTIENPSVSAGNTFERPAAYALGNVEAVTPTGTAYTQVGNGIDLPASFIPIGPGVDERTFDGIVFVAQLTFNYFTSQKSAMFRAGEGAAKDGPISFCPPVSGYVGGNTNCTFWEYPNDPGATPPSNNRQARLHIESAGPANVYGGVLDLMRDITGQVWLLKPPFPAPPLTGATAIVSKNPRTLNEPFPGGIENFDYVVEPRGNGPNYPVTLAANGAVAGFLTTTNCGTPPCNIGTPTTEMEPGTGWGFRMTTGLVSGSDSAPPVNATTDFFFFVSQGADTTEMTTGGGTNRNLVLLGGSVAKTPGSGTPQTFNRITKLRMTVPEPGAAIGLALGVVGLVGLALRARTR